MAGDVRMTSANISLDLIVQCYRIPCSAMVREVKNDPECVSGTAPPPKVYSSHW